MESDHIVKLLLVDDRKENLLSLEVILANRDYVFVRANSGKEALKILMKERDFAIILLDVQMPVMDGFETAELIRSSETLRNIPIIFLTASLNTPEHIFKGYQSGAVDYMLKPLSSEILQAKVAVFADLHKKTKELKIQSKNLKMLNSELEKRSSELSRINQELEKFAYVASHDMQEPLRTITSYIQLLENKLNPVLDEESKEFMGFVVNASLRMRSIIVDLLEYSRINKADKNFDRVDCSDVLRSVTDNLQKTIQDNKAKIDFNALPVLNANYNQMVQLFQNLIGNAIKFKGAEDPVVRISFKELEGHYLFTVEDNGIGIEQKYANKIFEVFQRLHTSDQYPGTGIGLAICMKIVEIHDGRIWMTSELGQGTRFYFTIGNN
jgi:signal transduction histidine kinase